MHTAPVQRHSSFDKTSGQCSRELVASNEEAENWNAASKKISNSEGIVPSNELLSRSSDVSNREPSSDGMVHENLFSAKVSRERYFISPNEVGIQPERALFRNESASTLENLSSSGIDPDNWLLSKTRLGPTASGTSVQPFRPIQATKFTRDRSIQKVVIQIEFRYVKH
jgi:hypothetical protein